MEGRPQATGNILSIDIIDLTESGGLKQMKEGLGTAARKWREPSRRSLSPSLDKTLNQRLVIDLVFCSCTSLCVSLQ
ncbi:hypothetical protein JOB18_006888 [Solea senegalensis]|uniref:Uncharacterized protein n=1 Tax=Solea senegalensis TaxID=28829 RepID=A0AAV6RWW3_SOLSE|nr:hypothetical protein JOB18_006888 [Solea senegalensis]